MTQAYPIQWPRGRARTKVRRQSKFKVKPTQAFEEMMVELKRFDAKNVVVSSNIPTRRDGTPYRDGLTELLEDPGVAVYFTKGKRQICLPCDTYLRAWENCRAIGCAVEAFRAIERHGAQQILDQAFEGFTALPSPDSVEDAPDAAWWVVLGVDSNATKEQVMVAYKNKARKAGGATIELNAAKEDGIAAAGERP
jgi:hypothetical protein